MKIIVLKQDTLVDQDGNDFPEVGNLIIFTAHGVLHLHQCAALPVHLGIFKRQFEVILQGFESGHDNRPVTHDTALDGIGVLFSELIGNIVVGALKTLLELRA